jgi:hypothetical protein
LEKRLKRVQRWVDRCVEACRCKAWNSAIAELECARAELDSASRELWDAAAGAEAPRDKWFRHRKAIILNGIPVAIAILFLAVGPTAIESFKPAGVVSSNRVPSVEWVTADEKVLLENLRKSLSQRAAEANPEGGLEKIAVGRSPLRRQAQQPQPGLSGNDTALSPSVQAENGLFLKAEDLLSLIQVGQRALRPDGESLRVERP